ncbi:SCO2322 family protein [Streptomyces longwoodensis]|uniref:SCO2322 family protein n=1 Tax=Streptomyces longwoodensis TaxID=68231 RepID=UPI0033E828AE
MTRRATTLLLTGVLTGALTALLCALAAAPAGATGYRYWSFWERTGDGWAYATQGPATSRPADGSVQGFRFAVSEDSADASRPRGAASFAEVCAGTPAREGSKRVALVIDFGTAADAPEGETPPAARTACARVAGDASTAEALAAVAKPLRYDTNALLCAIADYPKRGCGEQVAGSAERKPAAAQKKDQGDEDDEDDGPRLAWYAGAAAVAALAAAAVWQSRRNRHD